MQNDLSEIFFFLNNRFRNNKMQYNIFNIYHIKYHTLPTDIDASINAASTLTLNF